MRAQDLVTFFQRAIQPLKNKVILLATRGIIESTVDTKGVQEVKLQGLKDENMNAVPRIQEFGFASRPPKGTSAIVINLGANRDNPVIIATDHGELRFKNLGEGESAIYTADGTYIHLKAGGEVEVKAATKLVVDVPNSEFKGNVKIEGNLEVDGDSTQTGAVTHESTLEVTGLLTATGGVTSPGAIQGNTVADATTSIGTLATTYNTHTHNENGDGGGVTDAPNEQI